MVAATVAGAQALPMAAVIQAADINSVIALNSVPPIGRHLLADLQGINPDILANPEQIETALRQAATAAGATPIFAKFHHFGPGQGVTGVLLLQESHISIHTWPEREFAAVDVFMCGDCQPEKAIAVLEQVFTPRESRIQVIERGLNGEV